MKKKNYRNSGVVMLNHCKVKRFNISLVSFFFMSLFVFPVESVTIIFHTNVSGSYLYYNSYYGIIIIVFMIMKNDYQKFIITENEVFKWHVLSHQKSRI